MAEQAIRVEGVRELTRAFANADKELGKRFATANREIGQRILSRLFPGKQSGSGRGAKPRAIASRNFVGIQAGRTDRRHSPVEDWGIRQVARDEPRPYILGTALREFPTIEKDYFDAVEGVLRSISDQT